jgi:hypothetical protein
MREFDFVKFELILQSVVIFFQNKISLNLILIDAASEVI